MAILSSKQLLELVECARLGPWHAKLFRCLRFTGLLRLHCLEILNDGLLLKIYVRTLLLLLVDRLTEPKAQILQNMMLLSLVFHLLRELELDLVSNLRLCVSHLVVV